MKVIVAGAGIFGLAAAIELDVRGHTVTVVAPGPIPHPLASSTDVSKMVRADYGTDAFYADLMDRAFTGWHRWNDVFGAELYHETGFLVMGTGDRRPGTFEGDSYQTLAARDYPLEPLVPGAVPGGWKQDGVGGYLNRRAGWAESGRVIESLARVAQTQGIEFIETGVAALQKESGSCVGVTLADGTGLAADCTVVAAGTWTPSLVPEVSTMVRIVGQPIVFFRPADPASFRPPRFYPWAADIANTGFYGFPAADDGTVKVANHGAGVSIDPDADRQVPPGTHEKFLAFLREWLPELARAPIVSDRLCLYTDTPDGDFLIDRHPEIAGLVVATGGSGHGFKFGPVLGGLIADAVEGVANPDRDRFRWSRNRKPGTEAARAGS